MKTEFEFYFSTHGFFFEKDHKFRATLGDETKPLNLIDGLKKLIFEFQIIRNDQKNETKVTQIGSLFLTIPLSADDAEKIVFQLLHLVVQQVNFNNEGTFEVSTAWYRGKSIPETEEERLEIGDRPYFIQMNLVESSMEPKFDSSQFVNRVSQTQMDFVLIQQHNHATQAKHPIDKYLSYYKIIEDICSTRSSTKKRITAKELLSNNVLLKEIHNSAFNPPKSNKEYVDFVSIIVDIRDKCSHLKRDNGFGYITTDERIQTEIEKYIDFMHYITHQLIIKNNKNV
ncbi:MAG: methylamine utilization protein MauJ [Methylococcaceae bacterium]